MKKIGIIVSILASICIIISGIFVYMLGKERTIYCSYKI